MSFYSIPVWREAPFIRLIVPLVTGILIQWYVDVPVMVYLILIPATFILLFLFSSFRSFIQFRHSWLTGIWVFILIINTGGFITYYNDFSKFPDCITRMPRNSQHLIVTLTEGLSEKNNSFKANAVVNHSFHNDSIKKLRGSIIIYFKKDSALHALTYNSRLAFSKKLQPITNTGNPGAFNYQRYCAFQQVFYQVYLKPGEYTLIPALNDHFIKSMLFVTRQKIVNVLRTYITGKKEAGLAEALLIGYKDDLDKNLVQSYSNTGVVHIIAISGLHVALIYWLLNLLLRPVAYERRLRWARATMVIAGIWTFSFLAGGSASVCRSAVMFSFIVIGENLSRKTNIYNSLAASAFLLLCYNPFWLWDAGFQLSYIAVLSIVIFMQPLYTLVFIKNKLLDHTWKLTSISIAAQILTTPLSIFHFNQFPNYFLVTNLVAVPLSSLVVLAELALCALAFIPYLAVPTGGIICRLIKLMNGFIEYINKMPYPVTDQLQLSLVQVIFIYLVISGACIWLFKKSKPALLFTLAGICSCFAMRGFSLISAAFQHKLVVYNIPHHQAIDLVNGRNCLFMGDSELVSNEALQNFHIKPSRIEYRVNHATNLLTITNTLSVFSTANKRIILINGHITFRPGSPKYLADIIVLSGDTNIKISELVEMTDCRMLIFDRSNPDWKISKWKTDCEKAGMPFYSVAEKGAFILNLN